MYGNTSCSTATCVRTVVSINDDVCWMCCMFDGMVISIGCTIIILIFWSSYSCVGCGVVVLCEERGVEEAVL